ncbi:MAG: glycosyltransferase [Planctomycetes bacterium]|nr:glycosyltransferase [Planctomycetota bacterium]
MVSAIVSLYRAERFVRGLLDDLLAQTIADRLEIVIIDSGSPENERSIVEEYQRRHTNVVYYRTAARETLYAAWNRAARLARGRYLTNANADDRHRPDALERLAAALDRDPEAALAYADLAATAAANARFEEAPIIGHTRWPDHDPRLLFRVCYVGPQPMWRRDLHERHGFFDPEFQSAGDYEFWLRVARAERFVHLPEVLTLYYSSGEGIEQGNPALSREESERARERYWPHSWGERPKPGGTYYRPVTGGNGAGC